MPAARCTPASPASLASLVALLVGGLGCVEHNAPCSTETDCAYDQTCVAGFCRSACVENGDCESWAVCVEQICRVVCNSSDDCGGRERCSNGACMPVAPAMDASGGDAAADAGSLDQDHAERGATDGAELDNAAIDSATADGGGADSALPDLLELDAAVTDLSSPELATMFADAAAPDRALPDAGPLQPCGTVSALADDFDDGIRGAQWSSSVVDDAMSVTEVGGEVVFVLADGVAGSHYSSYHATPSTLLEDDAVTIELTQATDAASGSETFLAFSSALSELSLSIRTNGAQLVISRQTSLGFDESTIPFEHSQHRWWSIHEAAGTISFEASADGVTWEVLALSPSPPEPMRGQASFGTGTWNPVSGASEVRFDNFSLGDAVGWCRASSFSDSFADDTLGDRWWLEGSAGCAASIGEGTLELAVDAADEFSCAIKTAEVFDLEGDQIRVDLLHRSSHPAVETGLTVWGAPDSYAEIFVGGGELRAWVEASGQYRTMTDVGFNALMMVRAGGELSLMASPDGVAWVLVDQVPTSTAYDAVTISIVLRHNIPEILDLAPSRITASFDNYNRP